MDEPRRVLRRRLRLGLGLLSLGLLVAAVSSRRPAPGDVLRGPGQFLPPERLSSETSRLDARLKEDPDDLSAMIALGVVRYQQGREHYIDGVNALEEALSLGAADAKVYYYLGRMYQDLGLYAFAVGDYQRFLRNRPEDRDVRLRLAKLEYQEGRFAEAVKDYEQLYDARRPDPVVRENLALSLAGAGRLPEARPLLEAMAQEPGDAARRADFFLGKLAASNGESNQASARLEKALDGGRDLPGVDAKELYALLASSYDKLKLSDKARPAWEKVLALDPGNREARAHLRPASRRSSHARHKRGDARTGLSSAAGR